MLEDERKTASFIRKALEAEGYAVDHIANGEDAVESLLTTPFDAVVMDIMVPGLDGLAVLRRIREAGCRTPVLLVSARSRVDERIEGLNAGADDYLPKPFALGELVARVRALCRRSSAMDPVRLEAGDLSLDTLTREVRRGGRLIELSKREYALLEFLLRSKGRVCSRMQLIEKVWDYHFDPGSNLVDVYVGRVRDKIDAEGIPKLLHTVRGIGYLIKDPP